MATVTNERLDYWGNNKTMHDAIYADMDNYNGAFKTLLSNCVDLESLVYKETDNDDDVDKHFDQ